MRYIIYTFYLLTYFTSTETVIDLTVDA